MTAVMSPADHVFIEALSALFLRIVADSRDEVMLADCAAQVAEKVNLDIPALRRVARAFAAWQAARKVALRPYREAMALNDALVDFHRWRLGQAQAALQARAA